MDIKELKIGLAVGKIGDELLIGKSYELYDISGLSPVEIKHNCKTFIEADKFAREYSAKFGVEVSIISVFNTLSLSRKIKRNNNSSCG